MRNSPNEDLIIVGYRDWCYAEDQGINVRDLHFAVELAESGRAGTVLFINRPVSLIEQILRLKRWKLKSGELVDSGFGYRLYKVARESELYVLCTWVGDVFSPLLLRRLWWNRIFKRNAFKKSLAKAKRKLGMREGLMMLCTPFGLSAIEAIGHKHLVFDVIDNFSKHPRMSDSERKFSRLAYEAIDGKADAITCVSAEAMKIFPKSKNLVLVRNGVDRGWLDIKPQRPREFASFKGKIIGFGGNITNKFDGRFLAALADSLPEMDFVLIGNILDRGVLSACHGIGNIHYLGFREFSSLPAYYYHLDVGIILYKPGLAHDGDPLKLYEFLSLGTPVISLPADWVQRRFDGVLFTEETPDAFRDKLREMAAADRNGWREKCRRSISEEDFWDSKAIAILNSVNAGTPK